MGSRQCSQTSSTQQKPQTNRSAYNSYSCGAWGVATEAPDPLPVPSSESAPQPGNYGNSIRKKRIWDSSAAPHLTFMSVPFLYHPILLYVLLGLVFFLLPPFLVLLCIQNYESLLWALPFPLLLPVHPGVLDKQEEVYHP